MRRQRRALQRIDGDVHLRRGAVADLLAVVEHRRLVLLALADHDETVHRHGLQHVAHAVDRGLVGRLLIPTSHQRGGGERGRLGHAHELQGEVAVGTLMLGLWGHTIRHAIPGTYTNAAATTIVAG